MKILSILLLLALALPAFATDYTSAGTGDWDEAATWSPSGVPAAGDRVTIADGDTVTIPTGYTAVAGDSPDDDSGTPAIQCDTTSGTGILAIVGDLEFRGPVRQCNSTWTVAAGATITHDSSAASTPADANYSWQIGAVNDQAGSKLVISGTSGSRVTFDIAASSGNAGGFQSATATRDMNQVQAAYANFDSWGTAAGYFIRTWPYTSGAGTYFDDCNISNSGQISLYGIRSNVTFRLLRTTTTSPDSSEFRYVELGYDTNLTATPTGGDLRIENSYIEGTVALTVASAFSGGDAGFTFRGNVFTGKAVSVNAPVTTNINPAFAAGNWVNNLLFNRIPSSSDTGALPSGTLQRTVLTRNYGTNPHWVFLGTEDTVIDGWIAEAEVDNGSYGDIFQLGGSTSASYDVSILNGITPPTPGGESPGVVVNYSTSTTCDGAASFCPAITVDHNIYLGDTRGLIGVGGEGNAGGAGLFASVQHNTVWRTTPGEGYITKWYPGTTPGTGTYTVADNNNWWNLTNSDRYELSDTNPTVYGSTPGGSDVNEDPGFDARTMLEWAQALDGTISDWDDILAEFAKVNQANFDPRFNVSDMYDWIRAGYVPPVEGFNSYRYTAGGSFSNFPDFTDPSQEEPDQGECVTDAPWFDQEVCKLTDVVANWNPDNTDLYIEKVSVSRWTTENADATLYMSLAGREVPSGTGTGHIIIYNASDNSVYAHPALNLNEGREPRWSDADPKLLYYIPLGTCSLSSYNIDTETTTEIHDFTAEYSTCSSIGNDTEGTSSIGNRYWAFMIHGPARFANTKLLAVVVYDLQEDEIVGELDKTAYLALGGTSNRWETYGLGGRPNAVDIAPSGDRVLLAWSFIAYPMGQNFQISAASATVSSGLMTVYSVRPPQTFFEVGDEVQFRLVSSSSTPACSGAAATALDSRYPIDSFVDEHTMVVDVSSSGLGDGSYSCSYINPAIVSAEVSSGTGTVTFGSQHFLEVGRTITLYGMPDATLNTTVTITAIPTNRTATFSTAASNGTYTTDLMYYRDPKNGSPIPDTNTSFTSYRPNTNADDGAHVYNLDFSSPVRVMNGETHSGWGWALNGDPVLVHQTNASNWSGAESDTFGFTDIYTGVYTPIFKHADMGFGPASLHHSRFYDNKIRGWAMFTIANPPSATSKLRGQMFLAELKDYDDNPEIWRVGWLHTDLGCTTVDSGDLAKLAPCSYNSEAQVSLSRDGLSYYWGTVWPNGNASINIYKAAIPLRVKTKGSFAVETPGQTTTEVSYIAPTADSVCTVTTSVSADYSSPLENEASDGDPETQLRTFTIGSSAALTPGTTYYSRITCGWTPPGDQVDEETIEGSFAALEGVSAEASSAVSGSLAISGAVSF